ncbi:hypothetical conserved protein [Rhizobium etli CFN 42]|nr:hypothetical conserved protein [Rhizobium etli CFN 42]
MVCGYLQGSKTPPQPLPTRGRGYNAVLSRSNLTVTVGRTVTAGEPFAFGGHCGPRFSPSPLWGGVGAGSYLGLDTERPA